MDGRIERAQASDANELTRIACRSKAHWGYPSHCLESWRSELTLCPAYIDVHPVFVLVFGGRIAGFYALSRCRKDRELDHLWIDPECIGRGFGRRLLEHAMGVARDLGAMRIEISSDPFAESFYLKMGAHRIGQVSAPIPGDDERCLPRLEIRLG